jgi:hypothetical protein
MKRFIVILTVVFYLFPSVGYSIDIQWCCNKISGISFSPVKPAKCRICATPKHCCKNTHIIVKLKDSQHNSSQVKVSLNTANEITVPIFNPLVSIYGSLTLPTTIQYRPPPLTGGQPIYLKTGVFRV